jgi:transposase
MSEIITIGLDLAKNVFQVHGADASGRAVLRKKLRRDQVLAFFGQLPPCVVAMKACGGAHFWDREIGKLGHEVRRIPPAYVKPFVKRQKYDAADAEAICEAALRPTMRFVPVKSEETQGAAMVFRIRGLMIRQRTQAIMDALSSVMACTHHNGPLRCCQERTSGPSTTPFGMDGASRRIDQLIHITPEAAGFQTFLDMIGGLHLGQDSFDIEFAQVDRLLLS